MVFKAFFSGACEPNPGRIITAYVVLDDHGTILHEHATTCGDGSNNTAEYLALRGLLDALIRLRLDPVEIYGSSQLVIHQILGRWNCGCDHLREFRNECRGLLSQCGNVTLQWIPQINNEHARRLVRAEMRKHGIQPRWRCGRKPAANAA